MTAPIAAQPKEVRGTVGISDRYDEQPMFHDAAARLFVLYRTGESMLDVNEAAAAALHDARGLVDVRMALAKQHRERLDACPSPLPSPTSDEIDQLLADLRDFIKSGNRVYALDRLSALSDKLGRVTR